ncbi:MAG: GTPase Era [Ignavibacteriales bacterium CG07_land_8_20_14_0_80_59_12]|nr:MAG: GTPase Era [Ignavibacteriales bacterium CG07_land_8_20_14_0_80_59_12]
MGTTMTDPTQTFRAGYAAIIGEPNVGKSTLMNAFLGQKISIVTPKPQTTRHRVLGIMSGENYQVVFLDTPGIITPKYRLQEVMMDTARSALADADVVLFMVDVKRVDAVSVEDQNEQTLGLLRVTSKPVLLVLNKIDLIHKDALLPMLDAFGKLYPFREMIPVSALTGDGVRDITRSLVTLLPLNEPFYPPDMLSEQSERFFAGEIVREKIFEKFREEVPYSTAVRIVDFKEREAGKDYINADIIVERESQKAILIGKGGKALREVGLSARRDIEEFLGRPVYLELRVKVREKWRDSDAWLKRLGYAPG